MRRCMNVARGQDERRYVLVRPSPRRDSEMSSCRRREPASAPLTAPILTVSFFCRHLQTKQQARTFAQRRSRLLGRRTFHGCRPLGNLSPHDIDLPANHLVVGAWIGSPTGHLEIQGRKQRRKSPPAERKVQAGGAGTMALSSGKCDGSAESTHTIRNWSKSRTENTMVWRHPWYIVFALIAWFAATWSNVWPSGGALTTASVPILPPAPGRLSVMKG